MTNPNIFQATPSSVSDVLAKPKPGAQPGRIGLWALILGLGGFLAWAALAPLDEGVPGQGMVTIDTKSKAVQHISGGIIKEVLVKEGQQVKEAMKSDMSGAAAVSAAVIAIAELKLPVAIESWAPLAENMPSDTATRPSDIITIWGGKTVEVLNPDAEGRLVLADGLMKAQSSKNKLDGIIDVATLTGAQVVALGTRTSAVMTNNQEFSDAFMKVTAISGEQFWPMPLPEELRASLDSPVADLANIGDRMGGMLVAGLFLKDFVNPELPWLHLDIAGPAYNEAKPHGYTPVGGTGIALRSLVTLAEQA